MRSLKWLSRHIGWTAVGLVALSGTRSAQADVIQRSFLNSSFEQTVLPDNCIYIIDEKFIPGWKTTHPAYNQAQFGSNCHLDNFGGAVTSNQPIEIWPKGNFVGVDAPVGTNHIELNAYVNSALFQTMCLIKDEDIKFSFYHRGRSSTTVPDVLQFNAGGTFSNVDGSTGIFTGGTSIGIFSTNSAGSTHTMVAGLSTTDLTAATPTATGWVKYSGTFTYTGASGNVDLQFGSLSTSGGGGYGNFLDDIQFYGKPVIELTASSTSGSALVAVPANPPTIRIVGQVDNPISVPVTIETSGSSAVQGNNFIPTNPGGTFNITIPVGNYDGINNGIFPIPFNTTAISANNGKTIVFNIGDSPDYTRRSTTDCAVAIPIVQATYSMTSNANLLLVKRVTAITDGSTGVETRFNQLSSNLAECNDGKNPHDYNNLGWQTGYLQGKCQVSNAKPGDEIEYTIYFLNGGGSGAKNVRVCDRLDPHLSFKAQFDAQHPNTAIAVNLQSNTTSQPQYLTSIQDGDAGYFIDPNVAIPSNLGCNLPSSAANPSGIVVVDLATGMNTINPSFGNPAAPNSYGYVRFKAKVKP